jgi:hypothetical protein
MHHLNFERVGVFICKALKGEAIVWLLRALNNAARRSRLLRGDESFRLALWVKIDEKKNSSSDLSARALQRQAGIPFG